MPERQSTQRASDRSLLDEADIVAALVAESSVREITLQNAGRRITIRRAHLPVSQDSEENEVSTETPKTVKESFEEELFPSSAVNAAPVISAPMVGVFHSADPAVTSGTHVQVGQVVGIIESMKLMNDVRAEHSCVIRDVLVEPGTPVEYGHPLFEIDV